MKTKTVLVTGGAGFYRLELSDEMIGRGAKVRIIDNFVTGFGKT
jgi:UDP-glucose 4-epimerase